MPQNMKFVVLLVTVFGMTSAVTDCQQTSPSDRKSGKFIIQSESSVEDCYVMFQNPLKFTLSISIEQFNNSMNGCSGGHMSFFTSNQPDLSSPRLLEKHCTKPSYILRSRLPLLVVTLTDYLNQSLSLSGSFVFSEEVEVDKRKHMPACGEQTKTDLSGVILFDSEFSFLYECNWVISGRSGYSILIRVEDMNLGNREDCSQGHYIGLYEGPADLTAPPDRQLCGQTPHHPSWDRQFISIGSDVGIRYSKGKAGSGSFKIEWNEIRSTDAQGDCASDEFRCKGGRYCIDLDGTRCQQLAPMCIDKRLRCDHLLNCGLLDESDEQRCDYHHQGLITGCVVVGVAGISCLVVGLYWRRKRIERHQRAIAAREARSRRQTLTGSEIGIRQSVCLNSPSRSTGDEQTTPAKSTRGGPARRSKDHGSRRQTAIDFNPLPMNFSSSKTYRF